MSLLILVALLGIGSGVFIRQYSFNPAVLLATQAAPSPKPDGPKAGANWLPPALKELGPPESFSPENLYDKIDGKAELYLSAGFVQMGCQRFALKAAPDQWLEWSVYGMAALPQAFSVFSTQRRAEGLPLGLTEFAYRTRNALYFVCGSNYVEAVGSAPSESLMEAALALAKQFVAANPSAAARLPELELFPSENLVPGGYTLQIADAFGFDQFKSVFTARYNLNGTEITAFMTSCSSPEAAAALRAAYAAFLLANGGKELPGTGTGATRIELMGGDEIFFSEGKFVAGVHAGPALEPAEAVARRLRDKLLEAGNSKSGKT